MTPAALKALRASFGWPQYRLAEELGITTRHLRKLEAGTTPISRAIELALKWVVSQKHQAPS